MALGAWKARYFEPGTYQPDDTRDEAWNRGAYLAEGLAHCGACHTPRDALGGEIEGEHWSGGMSAGWSAYAIDEGSHAPVPWDEAAMAFYLRHGWHGLHGVSRGPMAHVTHELGLAEPADVEAIARYTVSVMGPPEGGDAAMPRPDPASLVAPRGAGQEGDTQGLPEAEPAGGHARGRAIWAGACAGCHNGGRPQPFGGLSLHLSSAIHAPDPQNTVNVTLYGLPPAEGAASAVMPGYTAVLSDADMVALLRYMRAAYTDRPPWTGLDALVRDTRSGAHPVAVTPADPLERQPEGVAVAEASAGAREESP